jgi:hypothetical protein
LKLLNRGSSRHVQTKNSLTVIMTRHTGLKFSGNLPVGDFLDTTVLKIQNPPNEKKLRLLPNHHGIVGEQTGCCKSPEAKRRLKWTSNESFANREPAIRKNPDGNGTSKP